MDDINIEELDLYELLEVEANSSVPDVSEI